MMNLHDTSRLVTMTKQPASYKDIIDLFSFTYILLKELNDDNNSMHACDSPITMNLNIIENMIKDKAIRIRVVVQRFIYTSVQLVTHSYIMRMPQTQRFV